MSYQLYLKILRSGIDNADSDPDACMLFWRNPSQKVKLVQDMLGLAISKIDNTQDHEACINKTRDIMKWLDNHWQDTTWPCHEVHFHTSFNEYIACPYTCLNEIVTCIDKICERMFTQ